MKLSESVKTDLVPNAGNTLEVIENITSMIKANIPYSRRAASVGELLCFQLVVELPLALESLQLSTFGDTNGRANRKLFLIGFIAGPSACSRRAKARRSRSPPLPKRLPSTPKSRRTRSIGRR